MDLEKQSFEEIKQGYYENDEGYGCNYCEAVFSKGEIFPIENRWFDALKAVTHHINSHHGGNFKQLIYAQSKYNTLTDVQKQLLQQFYLGNPDKTIADALGVSGATVRRQRFTFKEKAKQAKMYLACYENVFGSEERHGEKDMIPIPEHLTNLDDRYMITEKEREQTLKTAFSSLAPLKLEHFPVKQKRKLIILLEIAKTFEKNKNYTEKEINQHLEEIYFDYVTIRRYLIEYNFLDREKDGSKYWVVE